MYCIYFIGGSQFTKNIRYHSYWISTLRHMGYVVKYAKIADLTLIKDECLSFIHSCNTKYTNPVIGVMGVSSGGYFALRIKKSIPDLQFCIGIAPIVDPVKRASIVQSDIISKNTPQVRKIYNKIDLNTLIIIGHKDKQAPIEIYDDYDIHHLYILEKEDHSITNGRHLGIYKIIHSFLK
jgi:esterase/lipase|tara:strand:- start:1483 stop:2022 length:540 start_codon:yes stop_codon:yes gene_type:complete